ncbi:NEK/NEK1 protein kinase [Salpingoeca rosetta]|uniref:non-specific serine/threonine protein kinase n=1 Tax=Salpingoeca rosetta (strain ATCC 50818 / BSB-021) TaxID=946362 RepID=F2UB07_SALR5|nr:NEK/NEK1 protein kinase [Salpingoeca rosetta]EGD74020.1 NEK/NEK1 protein kinase [Salpingoeca rosetta]|eukprot:XP_004993582.1 NEK/NEK1 protein kinase [Salpingoeca rosetta]
MEVYTRVKNIGSGSYGSCVLVQRKDNGAYRVIKQIKIDTMSAKEREEAKFEASVMLSLNHPNIVKLLDPCFIQGGYLHIVMEYAENGDLCQAIDAQRAKSALFEESNVMNWFVQVTSALSYCHSVNLMHRDIKSQNVFIMRNGIVKLGDFGIAKVLSNNTQFANTLVGTPYNLSPELCEDKPYGKKSDIWALGCLLYEMLTLNHPFNGKSLPALVLKIMNGRFPPISGQYSQGMHDLINSLLANDPSARPSAAEILHREFVKTWCYENLLERRRSRHSSASSLAAAPTHHQHQQPQQQQHDQTFTAGDAPVANSNALARVRGGSEKRRSPLHRVESVEGQGPMPQPRKLNAFTSSEIVMPQNKQETQQTSVQDNVFRAVDPVPTAVSFSVDIAPPKRKPPKKRQSLAPKQQSKDTGRTSPTKSKATASKTGKPSGDTAATKTSAPSSSSATTASQATSSKPTTTTTTTAASRGGGGKSRTRRVLAAAFGGRKKKAAANRDGGTTTKPVSTGGGDGDDGDALGADFGKTMVVSKTSSDKDGAASAPPTATAAATVTKKGGRPRRLLPSTTHVRAAAATRSRTSSSSSTGSVTSTASAPAGEVGRTQAAVNGRTRKLNSTTTTTTATTTTTRTTAASSGLRGPRTNARDRRSVGGITLGRTVAVGSSGGNGIGSGAKKTKARRSVGGTGAGRRSTSPSMLKSTTTKANASTRSSQSPSAPSASSSSSSSSSTATTSRSRRSMTTREIIHDSDLNRKRQQMRKDAKARREEEKRKLQEHERRVRQIRQAGSKVQVVRKGNRKPQAQRGSSPSQQQHEDTDADHNGGDRDGDDMTAPASLARPVGRAGLRQQPPMTATDTTAAFDDGDGDGISTSTTTIKTSLPSAGAPADVKEGEAQDASERARRREEQRKSLRARMREGRKRVNKEQDIVVEIKLSDKVKSMQHRARTRDAPARERVRAKDDGSDATSDSEAEQDRHDVQAVVSNLEKAMTSELAANDLPSTTTAATATTHAPAASQPGANKSTKGSNTSATRAATKATKGKAQQPAASSSAQAATTACSAESAQARGSTATQRGEDALAKHVLELRGSCVHALGADLFDQVYEKLHRVALADNDADKEADVDDAMHLLRQKFISSADTNTVYQPPPQQLAQRMIRRVQNLICCEGILLSSQPV